MVWVGTTGGLVSYGCCLICCDAAHLLFAFSGERAFGRPLLVGIGGNPTLGCDMFGMGGNP